MGVGLLRLLFSLSVVFTHAGKIFGFNFVNPVVAVESFYIISGFYMALILTEKYTSVRSFFATRALRIYPMYLVVLLATFLLGAKGSFVSWTTYALRLQPLTLFSLIATNIVIFGQDILTFLGISAQGGFYPTGDFHTVPLPALTFLLISQSWTIALELIFYLTAPLLVQRTSKLLITLTLFSLSIRLYLASIGLSGDPWSYRFFPSELALFISGIMSYRLYIRVRTMNIPRFVTLLTVPLLIALISAFQYLAVPYEIKRWSFYALFMALLPLAFENARKSLLDRRIGEFSYPLYISHVFVMQALPVVSPWFNSYFAFYHINAYPAVIVVFSGVFSLLLLTFVQNPIEAIRTRLAQAQRKGTQIPKSRLSESFVPGR